jgi:REP element-mobilizing transposase RayT
MSYLSLHYHITFATKERRAWLGDDLRQRLWPFLGGMIQTLGGHPVRINGVGDHVHLAVGLSGRLAIADVLRDIKANSSAWIHDTRPDLRTFAWQDGYAAFTVSRSRLDDVVRYIDGQEEHHRHMSFVDELRQLLDRHGIAYDPRYLV